MSRVKFSDYSQWSRDTLFEDPDDKRSRHSYTTFLTLLISDSNLNKITDLINKEIENFKATYHNNTGFNLLVSDAELVWIKKTYESLLSKLYRQNIINNKNFPSPPNEAWLTLENYKERINDLVRGRIVCKYIDGVPFLAEEIAKIFDSNRIIHTIEQHAQESGHYAYHIYFEIEYPELLDGDFVDRKILVELQIITQMQVMINELNHRFYEESRMIEKHDNWKWDYKKPAFKGSFLSHTLHFLDALLLEIRHPQPNKQSPEQLNAQSTEQSVDQLNTQPTTTQPNE